MYIFPHWTTTARKTEEMIGDRTKPLGLILEWIIIIIIIIIFFRVTGRSRVISEKPFASHASVTTFQYDGRISPLTIRQF
jgi:hypothetical protein